MNQGYLDNELATNFTSPVAPFRTTVGDGTPFGGSHLQAWLLAISLIVKSKPSPVKGG
jgi:hypothetical protein